MAADTEPSPTPPDAEVGPADRWRQAALAWAVPDAILAKAPQPPSRLEPEMFRWNPEEDAKHAPRPSRRRALEALPDAGSVLDVGVGGGASSLGLVPRAALITGVDHHEGMLESFEESGRVAGVATRAVQGTWPEMADQVEPADIAVCHHAVYGVAEIEPFLDALTKRARHRVILEVSAQSPLAGLNPLWRAFHGIDRPDRAVADELESVLEAMGLVAGREDLVLPPRSTEVTDARVAFARRRLCVTEERDPEIAEFLRGLVPQEQRVIALWWPGQA